MSNFPKRYNIEIEEKWQQYWLDNEIYKFNESELDKKPLYVIDTPPPFTSGIAHMGHVLSYTYFDIAARYKRMKGFLVLYPQGWDTQGFPTEVKVEKKYGRLPPKEFRKKCEEWSMKMIKSMKEQFIKLGFSPDWNLEYKTLTPEYHKNVQQSIIEMWKKGEIYRDSHPVLWCPKCKSAIAKAETEEKEEETEIYYYNFFVNDKPLPIASTRPELLHACVAVVVNPNDTRYKNLIGKKARTPFEKEVPIISEREVDPNFGTGAVMLCTYGDKTDLIWQKRNNLKVIKAIDKEGRIINSPFYNGLETKEARKKVVEWLKEHNFFIKQEKIKHIVKIHDRCKTPIELLPSTEWFASVKKHAKDIKEMAHKIKWHPSFGIHYLIDWIDNIDWDWVISRDRIFGTPIPFYVCEKCGHVEPADELPFYPEKAKPKKCPKCNALMEPEKKVLDVWVDSSITPLVISGYFNNKRLFKKAYPTTLRPQGVEIVRTWAFYTIYRSGVVITQKPPWKEILLNGNVLAPDGKKMSKSLGNIINPMDLRKQYPTDAIRQWAAMSGAMAKDRPFSYEDIKFANQFLNKFWNIARFSSIILINKKKKPSKLRTVDEWILSRLEQVREKVSKALNEYDFRDAIITLQHFTWYEVADYYIEYIKWRAYSDNEEEKQELTYILDKLLYNLIKLFAPFTPHITEEIYNNIFKQREGKSIHLTKWPEKIIDINEKAIEQLNVANEIVRQGRDYKARNRIALNAIIEHAIIKSPITLSEDIIEDIKKTLKIENIKVKKEEEPAFEI